MGINISYTPKPVSPIKSIQRGSNGAGDHTITSVNTAKATVNLLSAFYAYDEGTNNTNVNIATVSASLLNATTIRVEGNQTVRWEVIEYI